MDILKRYFLGNTAPIVQIRFLKDIYMDGRVIPCRGANFRGFYWRFIYVIWRVPYCSGWIYSNEQKRWVIRAEQKGGE